ncbi:AmmeMemoRadiSam system protein A [bacterium]|nr:AmmeMemoRadiSam system protein A [bacterium]
MNTLRVEEKKELLNIARTSIEEYLKNRRIPTFSPSSTTLLERKGAFVTLKKAGFLRGCIGMIEALKPLYQTVAEMAVAAAIEDPRFPPLTLDELPLITIEISVLSPLEEVKDIEEIEVGKHGLYIIRGFYRGLLLPQVATENNWDRETFLQHTCLKAGLPIDCWQDPETKIYKFSAEVFSEEELD